MATLQPNQSAVIATFDTHPQAELGVKELQKSGFDMNKLSIIGPGYHSEEHPLGFYIRSDRIKTWGGIGAFWGSLWGILLGAAFFWVPGFGPLAVAGPHRRYARRWVGRSSCGRRHQRHPICTMGGATLTRNHQFHCASVNYDGIMGVVRIIKNVRAQVSGD